MNTPYDDNTIDALIAASLRTLKEEPTDEQIEDIFSSSVDLGPRDEAVVASARTTLIAAMSGKAIQDPISSAQDTAAERKFAAMNRDNADNEFDETTKDAIEDARRKALEELKDVDDLNAEGYEEGDRGDD